MNHKVAKVVSNSGKLSWILVQFGESFGKPIIDRQVFANDNWSEKGLFVEI